MMSFNDQTVMITGAAGNLGQAVSAAFAAARLTETMAAELPRRNINVNCALPRLIPTSRPFSVLPLITGPQERKRPQR